LEVLTESVKKIAANQQAPMANAPASIEFGGDVAKSLTSSFDTYARNLEDLTESVKKIAANQQQAPVMPAAPTSIELGGDFSKALTASFEAYSHNLEHLTESIKQIAANNVGQQAPSASGETVLPNFTDSISAVLKENAQQQMDVLKSFGEMLSKTIADSQRELVSSIKSSNRSSMILGKFMEVPVDKADNEQNSAISYSKGKDFQVIEQEPEVSILSASAAENVGNIRTVDDKQTVEAPVAATPKAQKQQEPKPEPKKEQKPEQKKEQKPEQKKEPEPKKEQKPEPQKEHKKEEKLDSKNEVKTEPAKKSTQENGKKSENQPKDANKDKNVAKAENITPKKPKEDIVDLNLMNLDTVSEPDSPVNDFDLNENEIDINDAFAQVAASLQSETTDSASDNLSQAFDTDFSDSPKAKDNAATPTPKQNTKNFDPMAQIRDALNSSAAVSLDNFDDDVSPISLSPEDDLQSAFSADDAFAAQDNQNNTPAADTASSFADNSWEYIGGNTAPNETSDDGDWEYEYVDENGNPINQADDGAEYEYVDENGNPINPSDDVEYEYVDENGNPINPSDDAEYEYVDEDGNPIDPSDDEEWEYEYVDENGNPINNG
ncbi:MAG: hypothetical protein IKR92_02535, partial [Alphaproteobacteria bacterium]|nr:hypothetical protein [Alphaproteobacteria bacterium]